MYLVICQNKQPRVALKYKYLTQENICQQQLSMTCPTVPLPLQNPDNHWENVKTQVSNK